MSERVTKGTTERMTERARLARTTDWAAAPHRSTRAYALIDLCLACALVIVIVMPLLVELGRQRGRLARRERLAWLEEDVDAALGALRLTASRTGERLARWGDNGGGAAVRGGGPGVWQPAESGEGCEWQIEYVPGPGVDRIFFRLRCDQALVSRSLCAANPTAD